MSIFPFIERFFTRRRAAVSASLGIDMEDEHLMATLGPRPELDAVGNAEHGRLVATLADTTPRELRDDERQTENDLSRLSGRFRLIMLSAFLLVAEATSSIFVVASLGVEGPHRLVWGTALAIAQVFLAELVSKARAPSPAGTLPSAWRRWLAIGLAITANVVLAAALTAVRLDELSASSGGSPLWTAAGAVILVALSVCPAWLLERVLGQLSPVLRLHRQLGDIRRRLRVAEREQRAAERAVEAIARAGAAWDRESPRLRAAYRIAAQTTRAEQDQ